MPANANEDSLVRLNEIHTSLDKHVDAIIQCIEHFLAENQQKLSQENLSDIKKVHESCLFLKDELSKLLGEGLSEKTQDKNFQEYLSKVRHDLHNPINIIQGYAEIVLEELQKTHPILGEKLTEITHLTSKIITLIDAIKLSSSIPSVINNPLHYQIVAEKNSLIPPSEESTESEDFQHFKEKFSILIVDDNEENCRILDRYLSRIGLTNTQVAHNGFQALAMKN